MSVGRSFVCPPGIPRCAASFIDRIVKWVTCVCVVDYKVYVIYACCGIDGGYLIAPEYKIG